MFGNWISGNRLHEPSEGVNSIFPENQVVVSIVDFQKIFRACSAYIGDRRAGEQLAPQTQPSS
jgi:hypothetical protein